MKMLIAFVSAWGINIGLFFLICLLGFLFISFVLSLFFFGVWWLLAAIGLFMAPKFLWCFIAAMIWVIVIG